MKKRSFIITKRNFVLPPIGLHLALFIRLIDLGTQYIFDEWILRILCYWELCLGKMDDGQPFIVSQEYTNTLGRGAKLKEHLEGWHGKLGNEAEIDLGSYLGEAAMINVTHRTSSAGNERSEIIAICPVPRGTVIPPQVNPSVLYSITDGENDTFKDLSSYLQEKIRGSAEFSGRHPTKSEIIERNVRQASANALESKSVDEINADLAAEFNGDGLE
jgi:hypothetical protein